MEIEFLQKGGIVIWFILLASVFALAIVFERLYAYWHTKKLSNEFLSKVKILVRSEKIPEAIEECDRVNIPIAEIFKAGLLNRHKERHEIKNIMEEVGALEVVHLEKYLPGLSTIATISPLMGLLGTVTGIVRSFEAIAASTGVAETQMLAGGISEALYTTVFGLFVAIPTVVFFNYFSKEVDRIVISMDKSSLELIDILLDQNNRVINDIMQDSSEA